MMSFYLSVKFELDGLTDDFLIDGISTGGEVKLKVDLPQGSVKGKKLTSQTVSC